MPLLLKQKILFGDFWEFSFMYLFPIDVELQLHVWIYILSGLGWLDLEFFQALAGVGEETLGEKSTWVSVVHFSVIVKSY